MIRAALDHSGTLQLKKISTLRENIIRSSVVSPFLRQQCIQAFCGWGGKGKEEGLRRLEAAYDQPTQRLEVMTSSVDLILGVMRSYRSNFSLLLG